MMSMGGESMSDIIRDPETEEFIDTLENNDIYRTMRDKFDEITNDGDEYLEEHDLEVAEFASKKFEISTEEAGDLYTNIEWQIGQFHEERKNRKK